MTIDDVIALLPDLIEEQNRHAAARWWQRVNRSMRVHLEGEYPAHLIDARRPNEPEEIKNFRKSNYSPITLSVFEEARDGLYRIFTDAESRVRVSQNIARYIAASNFEGLDFISFVQTHLIHHMLVDPNAWVVALPVRRPFGQPDIKLQVIQSQRVWAIEAGLLVWQGLKSDLQGSERQVWWALTDSQLIRIAKVGAGQGQSLQAEIAVTHNAGVLPAVVLGGILSSSQGGEFYYDSFFRAAIPFADEAVKQYSDYYAALVTSSYAIRELRAVECTAPGCESGKIYGDDNQVIGICSVCHGTGYVPDSSPYGVYLQPTNPLDPEATRPPVVFHTPPVEPLQYAERAWQGMIDRLRESLHLRHIDEAQSGTAKMIDREAAYAQLSRISNHVWNSLIWNLLDFMERMRATTTGSYVEPVVTPPSEFTFRTESDLIRELSFMRQSNIPSDFILEVMRELVRKRYAGSELIQMKQLFLMSTDPLYDATPQLEAFYFNAGVIGREEALYTIHAGAVLELLIQEEMRAGNDPIRLFDDPEALRARIITVIRSIAPQRPNIELLA